MSACQAVSSFSARSFTGFPEYATNDIIAMAMTLKSNFLILSYWALVQKPKRLHILLYTVKKISNPLPAAKILNITTPQAGKVGLIRPKNVR